jgi:hypothetical protein
VTIGVAVFHVTLFLPLLFTTSITLPPEMFARTLSHPVVLADYLSLAWLAASVATLGEASGREDDDAVKAAAYARGNGSAASHVNMTATRT